MTERKGIRINFETISIILLFFFIISRQSFRAMQEYYYLWSIARLAFYGVVILDVLKNPKIEKNSYFTWAVSFLAFAFFCSLISPHRDNSFAKLIETAWVFWDALIVLVFCQRDKKRYDLVFWALTMAGVVVVSFMLLNFSSSAVVSSKYLIQNRVSLSKSENPNLTAYKLFFSFISICYLIKFKKIKSKIGFPILAFIFAGMLLTGSRKTFLIGIPVLAILFMGGKHKIAKIISIIVLVYSAYFLVMNNEVLYRIIGWRLEMTGGVDESGDERNRLIIDALRTGSSHLFGVGLHNFMYYARDELYAHNNYAELFADLGVFGVIIYYSFIIKSALKIITLHNKEAMKYWLVYLFAYMAMDYGQVSYNLFSGIIMIAILFMFVQGGTLDMD